MKTGIILRVCMAAALAWLISASPVGAAETVRVMVMDGLDRLVIHFPPEYEVDDKTGEGVVKHEGGAGESIVLDKDDRSTNGIRIVSKDQVININQYALTGVIEVRKNKKGLFRIINELPIEDYIRSVVGEEMSSGWPIEALKAQAVITRTYTRFRMARNSGCDYDLCSTVNSQVFTGAREKDGPARAARETEGEILTYGGAPIEALYHASCGGSTEDARDVWDTSAPYLKARDCSCQKESPYKQWERDISADEIGNALRDAGYNMSGITAIKVVKKSRTGRAMLVWVETEEGETTVKGNDFRKALGYSRLPSTDFKVSKDGAAYVFTGKGAGHGVGLCQWGAKVMAEAGNDYSEILKHYYPGAKLDKVSGKAEGFK